MIAGLQVIVGMGLTGSSIARYFTQQNIPFAMIDTRLNPPQLAEFKQQYPNVQVVVGGFDENLLEQASRIILSPGIPANDPIIVKQVKRGIPVIGDIELFAKVATAPIIAITGTNAKSTVTTLVYEMAKAAGLKAEIGGNIGIPVMDLWCNNPNADIYVLELSSFQLEITYSLKPAVATILNLSPDHMDRYEDFAAYCAAKQRIYHDAVNIICNLDDPLTDFEHSNKNYFTLQKPAFGQFGIQMHDGSAYLARGEELLLAVQALPVKGKHYQANALAALALGSACGLSLEAMLSVLKTFRGLAHRCQLVGATDNVQWINDSKGTNVGATLAALVGLGPEINGKIVLIAGGVGKHADFKPLLPAMKDYVREAVLIGEAAQELAQLLKDVIPTVIVPSMEAAVSAAAAIAHPNDIVLLSPACASLDMFKNFTHRGDVFIDLVKSLPNFSL